MSKTHTTEPEQAAEFDLKHRVTGAAVLLFLGALVFPWLLGPPSQASKLEVGKEAPVVSEVEAANIITSVSDSSLSASIKDIEETVYISKITPLDAKGSNTDNKPAKPVPTTSAPITIEEATPEQDAATVLGEIVEEANTALSDAAAKNKPDNAQSQEAVAAVELESNAVEQEQTKREQELQAALASEVESQKTQEVIVAKPQPKKPEVVKPKAIDVGWVVQVGLFTEKSRAIALTSELKNKGFTASSSVVDTNRGKNTGTRVWLGPFSKRVSAINEQKRLKSKAGKDGFVRVYP